MAPGACRLGATVSAYGPGCLKTARPRSQTSKPSSGPTPSAGETFYKLSRRLNDISVLSKSCHGRNVGLGEAVIWRMSDY